MLTHDRQTARETRAQRQRFAQAMKAEKQYARKLGKVAKRIGQIVNTFPPGDPRSVGPITRVMADYSQILRPWATATAGRMLTEVSRRNEKAWSEQAATMGRALRAEIQTAPTGKLLQDLLAENVDLITSLPRKAAERVHKLTLEGIVNATRAPEIAKEIMRSGQVSESSAKLIARTEVARTSSLLTESRATHVGSEGYIWRTAGDSDVRESHRKMNGKYVAWAVPPTLSDGTVTHAGQIYNCRCYPEPVIPDID